MPRHLYIVAYDIAAPGRLRQVAQIMEEHGDRLQYSIFLCTLSAAHRELLITKLSGKIHHREDRILLVDLGPAAGTAMGRFHYLGYSSPPPDDGPLII